VLSLSKDSDRTGRIHGKLKKLIISMSIMSRAFDELKEGAETSGEVYLLNYHI